jgi:hypothetical protein
MEGNDGARFGGDNLPEQQNDEARAHKTQPDKESASRDAPAARAPKRRTKTGCLSMTPSANKSRLAKNVLTISSL